MNDKILPDMSIIISINNEEQNIGILYAQLRAALKAVNKQYEIIFVEDGSDDNSYMELCRIFQHDRSVKIIKLNKNVGQSTGLLVGMNFAKSEIIITMDGDLQHDPEDILKLIEKIDSGYDLVNGRKTKRADNLFVRVLPSLISKRLVCLFFGLGYCDINSTFRAYRHNIAEDIRQKGEEFRFLPLISKARKINFCEVDIICRKREFGRTHYDLKTRLERLTKDIFLLLSLKGNNPVRKKIDLEHLVSELRFH